MKDFMFLFDMKISSNSRHSGWCSLKMLLLKLSPIFFELMGPGLDQDLDQDPVADLGQVLA